MSKFYQAYADTYGGGKYPAFTVDDFGSYVEVNNWFCLSEASYATVCELYDV